MVARAIPRSHTTLTGRYPNGRGGSIPYESRLERDFILLTRFHYPDAYIVSQPIVLSVPEEHAPTKRY